MSSFSRLSVDHLLQEGGEQLQGSETQVEESYRRAREIRGRVEAERLAELLQDHWDVTDAISIFMRAVCYLVNNLWRYLVRSTMFVFTSCSD